LTYSKPVTHHVNQPVNNYTYLIVKNLSPVCLDMDRIRLETSD